jgi:hypothetical protein
MVGSLVATSLAAQSPGHAARIDFAADVPLVEMDGVPCVQLRMGDGTELLFGIDTGNVNTCIDSKVAAAAGLAISALPPPMPRGYSIAVMPEQHVGALALEGRRALAFDFSANKMPRIAGTLAYPVFKDRILQIDFAAHRVRISGILTGAATDLGPRDGFSLVTFGKEGPPIVVARGFNVDGKPVTAQVDTMYTGSLVIYSASIARLGLGSQASGEATEFFPLTDGGVNMKVAPAGSETFHGTRLGLHESKVYFPTKGVHEPDGLFDATVGLALFGDAVLTLNFHDDTISVTRPGTQAPAAGTGTPRARIPFVE